MNTHRTPFLPSVTATILLFCMGLLAAALSAAAQTPTESKTALNTRLDSLEMEKQRAKRQGEPLARLDSAITVCKDSIAALRQEIALTTPAYSAEIAAAPRSHGAPRLAWISGTRAMMQRRTAAATAGTFLDWIIVAVALVAIVSAIVLITGLMRTFVFKPKKRRTFSSLPRQNSAQSYTRQGLAASEEPALPRPPVPLPAAPASTGFDMEALRRKIAASEEPKPAPIPPPFMQEAPLAAAEDAPDSETIKQRIIQAGKEGLSVAEISKKFHVSVDSVALILKIAANKNR